MRVALLQRAEAMSSDRGLDSDERDRSPRAGSGPREADSRSDRALDPAPSSRGDFDAHLAGCANCRAELARAARRMSLVRSLAHLAAPIDLDGAVVAALQAGVRQERAIQAVTNLTPVAAPEVLARRVAAPTAPAVLERLVGEDLADPAKALASRYTRRLERLRAPPDLEQRLGRAPRRSTSLYLPIALAAAGLLLTVGALGLGHFLRGTPRGLPSAPVGPELIVEYVGSVRDLDPLAAELLAGFTGGLVDAERVTREEM